MHHHSDILGNVYLSVDHIRRFDVGAVGETAAIGKIGGLQDTIEEYFPLGVVVRNIDIIEITETRHGIYHYKRSTAHQDVSSTFEEEADCGEHDVPISLVI